jgi:hypothetical protein
MQGKDFHERGGGQYKWKKSRPYYVALEDSYVRAHWGFIGAVCKMNSIPFDADRRTHSTGRRVVHL